MISLLIRGAVTLLPIKNLDTFFHILLYQTELQNSKVPMGFEPTTRDFADRMNIFAVRIYCGLHLLFYEWAQIKETNKCERPINFTMAGTVGFDPTTTRLWK